MPTPLVVPGEVRQPRARVLLNGKPVAGLKEVEVTSNNHYQADRFAAEFALNAEGAPTLDWWSKQDKIKLAVSFGYEQRGTVAEWVNVITGEVDRLVVQPEQGTVRIDGRDLTARLIEAKTQEAFQNKTASEIATLIAQRHGLTPVVTATTTLASRYYSADHDRVTHDQFSHVGTEWDLLSKLASLEGFDCFVKGDELHFQPATKPDADPFTVEWRRDQGRQSGDVMNLRLERSLTLAKDIVVEVRSWRSRQGRGVTRTSPSGLGSLSARRGGTVTRYKFTRPNLTESQAQQEADRIREELTKGERNITFTAPGELRLTPRDMVRLSGTDSTWDQAYFVEEIIRTLSMERGFTMTAKAKNKSGAAEAEAGAA